MKKAILLFNIRANSRDTEDMLARDCEATLNQMFPGDQWVVRTGTDDGEMRMKLKGIPTDSAGWVRYFNTWLKEINTADTDGDVYSALICGHEDGGMGKANATTIGKIWDEQPPALPRHRVFILVGDGQLQQAAHFSRIKSDNDGGIFGRLV
jgi:hypothetical protein